MHIKSKRAKGNRINPLIEALKSFFQAVNESLGGRGGGQKN